ncbi:MAG: hypothetical protein K2L88_00355 [Clostridiales bacterium]|nr:hypothetical protein [Clostridiales bacterium]
MAVWIFALIALVAVFLTIATLVLPKLFLHNKCALTGSMDRGIKRTVNRHRETCLYEPAPRLRKYIKKYVLTTHEGKKVLVCKLGNNFKFLDYDIVVFDGQNKVRCILNVREALKGVGYTRVIRLPDETAYVSLNINGVDDMIFPHRVLSRVSGVKVLIFALCSAALVLFTVVGIRICCSYLFGGVFSESLLVEGNSTIFTIIIGSVVAFADLALTLIFVFIINRESAGKKERKSA